MAYFYHKTLFVVEKNTVSRYYVVSDCDIKYISPGECLMSDQEKSLNFTLADHDVLVQCANGIQEIIKELKAMEARSDSIEARVKNVEDWKIRVMAIVGVIGVAVGFIFGKLLPRVMIVKSPPHIP